MNDPAGVDGNLSKEASYSKLPLMSPAFHAASNLEQKVRMLNHRNSSYLGGNATFRQDGCWEIAITVTTTA